MKRGSKEEERQWRNVIKMGSKLDDREDIQRRKELATIALAKNDTIWKKNWKTKLTTRIRLYETLVKSVLFYNCGTWRVSKDDQRNLNSFYRRQLRKVLGSSGHIKYPTINCIRSQEQSHCRSPWQRGDGSCWDTSWDCQPTVLQERRLRYYFEKKTNKIFRGRRRTTIVSTLNEDINRTKDGITFSVTPLLSQVNLQNLYTEAKNRKLWSKIV